MTIELVGLPGSGKTYMTDDLARVHNLSIATNLVINKNILVIKFFFKNPSSFLKLLYWTIKYHNGSLKLLKHKIFFILFRAVSKEFFAKENTIIDDGILQYIIAISDTPLPSESIDKMLREFNLCNRTIKIVEVDDNVRKNRIKQRNRYPRSQFGKEYIKNFNVALHSNYFHTKKILIEKYNASTK